MKQYNYRHIKTSIVWKQEWNRSVSLFPKFGSINMAELQEKMKSKQSNEALKTKMSEVKLHGGALVIEMNELIIPVFNLCTIFN